MVNMRCPPFLCPRIPDSLPADLTTMGVEALQVFHQPLITNHSHPRRSNEIWRPVSGWFRAPASPSQLNRNPWTIGARKVYEPHLLGRKFRTGGNKFVVFVLKLVEERSLHFIGAISSYRNSHLRLMFGASHLFPISGHNLRNRRIFPCRIF